MKRKLSLHDLKRICDAYGADHLDLMRDEFMRIRSCPGADTEIRGLCDRAISGIERIVPLIVECDRLRRDNESREVHLRTLCTALAIIAGVPSSLNAAVDIARKALQDRGYMEDEPHEFNRPYLPNRGAEPTERGAR